MSQVTQQELERYEQLQLMALDFARQGEVATLQSMLQAGLSPNTCDHKGNTLLMLSCYSGHLECAKMLLRHGADANKANDYGHSILAGVAFKGYLDIAKLLIQNGAVIERHPMKNPIVFASLFGRKDMVEYLQKVQNTKPSLASRCTLAFSTLTAKFRKKTVKK